MAADNLSRTATPAVIADHQVLIRRVGPVWVESPSP